MNRQCLICDSRAVLTRDAAKGLALLLGLVDGAFECARSTPDEHGHTVLIRGLAAVVPACPTALAAADDVARYHFGEFDCLCVRCGARFNEEALITEGISSG